MSLSKGYASTATKSSTSCLENITNSVSELISIPNLVNYSHKYAFISFKILSKRFIIICQLSIWMLGVWRFTIYLYIFDETLVYLWMGISFRYLWPNIRQLHLLVLKETLDKWSKIYGLLQLLYQDERCYECNTHKSSSILECIHKRHDSSIDCLNFIIHLNINWDKSV